MLETLTSKPEVWSKTALFITYDENDCFFDHVVPPYAPQSRQHGSSTVDTANEYFAGDSSFGHGPYGLGPRVPMIIVSPWTAGGWSCSQVFDHSSLIRFIERRFGGQYAMAESNITPWRRAVCGDLSSAFNFERPDERGPQLPETDTSGYAPKDRLRHADYVPVPPARQAFPKQERGLRRARALPYELLVHGRVEAGGSSSIDFRNTGRAGAAFHVTSGQRSDGAAGPWRAGHAGRGGLSLRGRQRKHRAQADEPREGRIAARRGQRLRGQDRRSLELRPGASVEERWHLSQSFGWYELSVTAVGDGAFLRRLAGHLETGRSSVSDPAIAT